VTALRLSGPVRALRRALSRTPALYVPLRRWRMPHTVVTRSTDLIIEGFPRSGNTWAEALIHEAGRDRLRLAHHSHAAAHVMQAVRWGVPAMVLFRDPDRAVPSYLTLLGNRIEAREAYVDYAQFYRAVLSLPKEGVSFFRFEDVTERPEAVLAALVADHDLPLATGPVDRQAVFARMDAKAARLGLPEGRSDSRPGRASDSQPEVKATAEARCAAPEAQHARAAAQAVFSSLRSRLDPP